MKNTLKLMGLISILLWQTNCGLPKATPQEACGFNQNSEGQRISWKAVKPVKMYVDPSFPPELRSAITNAMNAWNQSLGKQILTLAGEKSGAPQHDNVNVIYWMTSWDAKSSAEQANTTIYYADNQLIEADIQINAAKDASGNNYYNYSFNPTYSQVDIQSLLTHELGHVLGLKHNASEPSVMAAKLADGTIRRDLYPSDLANSKCEY